MRDGSIVNVLLTIAQHIIVYTVQPPDPSRKGPRALRARSFSAGCACALWIGYGGPVREWVV